VSYSSLANDKKPLVGPYEHGNEPKNSIKGLENFMTSWATVRFSRRTLLHEII
jgi:hypothetical protein